jgi:hypothetical protein
VLVQHVDLVDRREGVAIAVALDGEVPLVGVLDVVGRQFAAVDGRLGVPADALFEP